MVADTLPPAVCPRCGAHVSLTLASDPSTPVYLCGSTPSRIVCDIVIHPTRLIDHNIGGLDPDDAAWLARLGVDVIHGATAMVWDRDPRIALGPCGHVTISGECLALDDPGRA